MLPVPDVPLRRLHPRLRDNPRATRQKFANDLDQRIDRLAELLSSRRGKKVGHAEAAAFFGLLAGTMQLARPAPERAESDAILEAGVRAALRLATSA